MMLVLVLALAAFVSSSAFPHNGGSDSLSAPHIAGGEVVAPHSLPYQVALSEETGYGYSFMCGGSLIAPQWILTAAHCVLSESKFEARLGVHDIYKREDWRAKVTEIFIHENYDVKLAVHDIALLKLDRSAPIDGEAIDTIRLPSISQRRSSLFWSKATISGWGHTTHQYAPNSPLLRSVDARILWGPYCKYYFWAGKHNAYFNWDLQLCTSGSGKKGACFGDSGGPLTVVESDGQKTLVGISSFIYDMDCQSGGPTAFTSVSAELDWIHNITDITLRP